MKKNQCEYVGLCKKMETIEQPTLSYWPRNQELKPYCNGNDSDRCSVYKMWNENPAKKRETEKITNLSLPVGAVVTSVCGPSIFFQSPGELFFYAACAETGIGLWVLGNGLTKKYCGKMLGRWLKTRKDRVATGEIYDRIVDAVDSVEDVDLDNNGIFGKFDPSIMAKRLSNIEDIEVAVSKTAIIEWNVTRFKVGKISASYPLTQDCTIMPEKDIGVVLSYEYIQRHCDDPDCDSCAAPSYYVTGVLDPVIHKGNVTEGTGFVEWEYMGVPLPIPSMDDDGRIAIGMSVGTATQIRMGKIDNFFGGQKIFDALSKSCMDEKTIIDARNVHKLMQEVLYSDF